LGFSNDVHQHPAPSGGYAMGKYMASSGTSASDKSIKAVIDLISTMELRMVEVGQGLLIR